MQIPILITGLVLMVIGALIKPKGTPIGFSKLFGWCGNSTILGKLIYTVGAILFLWQLIPWIESW